MTTLLYSKTCRRPSVDGASIVAPGQKKPQSTFGHAAGADEQADVDVAELAAEPEVALLLADDLADQRRGPALEVVAVVDEVVAVGDEARDGVVRGHELGDERALLVVAHLGAEAVGIDGQVLGLALGEDLHSGNRLSRARQRRGVGPRGKARAS